jgi:hypothetical protein
MTSSILDINQLIYDAQQIRRAWNKSHAEWYIRLVCAIGDLGEVVSNSGVYPYTEERALREIMTYCLVMILDTDPIAVGQETGEPQ